MAYVFVSEVTKSVVPCSRFHHISTCVSTFCFLIILLLMWCVKKLSIAAKTEKSQQKAVKLDLAVSQPSLRKLPYIYAFLYLCAMCQLQSEGFDFVFSLFICVKYTENYFR